jgi:hypothetical protein
MVENSYRPNSVANDEKSAVDLLITQRARILAVKMTVFATQIHERLKLRRRNLDELLTEELEIGSAIGGLEPRIDIRNRLPQLYAQKASLLREQQLQDVECWRDLAPLFRDFLNAWEGHEQARVRGEFLKRELGGNDDE